MMRPNRAERMLGRRAWVSCNAGADVQIHHRGEHVEIHRIDRLMLGDAHIIHDSKHVSTSSQVLGESIGLTMVCQVRLDKHSGKMSGELRATPMTDQPCSDNGPAAARPIPFDAPVITMGLRKTSPQICSRLLDRRQIAAAVGASWFMRLVPWNQHVLRWFALISRDQRPMLLRAPTHNRLPARCVPSTDE